MPETPEALFPAVDPRLCSHATSILAGGSLLYLFIVRFRNVNYNTKIAKKCKNRNWPLFAIRGNFLGADIRSPRKHTPPNLGFRRASLDSNFLIPTLSIVADGMCTPTVPLR
jgi:hypothetical protein